MRHLPILVLFFPGFPDYHNTVVMLVLCQYRILTAIRARGEAEL